ncbi:MAG: phosphohydrolase [Candidatus Bathyarchaeota archaeon]|nr:phosphohydrolase [Candidatus Bathyarchaeota archaeon]
MEGSSSESCPGIKKFLRPKPEYITCPNCAGSVEIWSAENTAECEICGKEVSRTEKEASCLDWCEFADKCREIIKNKQH